MSVLRNICTEVLLSGSVLSVNELRKRLKQEASLDVPPVTIVKYLKILWPEHFRHLRTHKYGRSELVGRDDSVSEVVTTQDTTYRFEHSAPINNEYARKEIDDEYAREFQRRKESLVRLLSRAQFYALGKLVNILSTMFASDKSLRDKDIYRACCMCPVHYMSWNYFKQLLRELINTGIIESMNDSNGDLFDYIDANSVNFADIEPFARKCLIGMSPRESCDLREHIDRARNLDKEFAAIHSD